MPKVVLDETVIDQSEEHKALWLASLICKVCDNRVPKGSGVGVHWLLQSPEHGRGAQLFCYSCFVKFILPEIRPYVQRGEVALTGQVRTVEETAAQPAASGQTGSPGPVG